MERNPFNKQMKLEVLQHVMNEAQHLSCHYHLPIKGTAFATESGKRNIILQQGKAICLSPSSTQSKQKI
jgi:hypothetical protein